jgi:hypothetical protein
MNNARGQDRTNGDNRQAQQNAAVLISPVHLDGQARSPSRMAAWAATSDSLYRKHH